MVRMFTVSSMLLGSLWFWVYYEDKRTPLLGPYAAQQRLYPTINKQKGTFYGLLCETMNQMILC